MKQHFEAMLDGYRFAGKRWNFVNPWSAEKHSKWHNASPYPRWMRK